MSDTYCTTCGEPYDIECLQEPEEYDLTLSGSMIVKCGACKWHAERGTPLRATAMASAALHDILGDDIDGVAAMMEDHFSGC